MKVRINSIASGKGSTAQAPIQKRSADGSRFAFLVSIADATNDVPVDIRFDSVASDGVKYQNFSGAYELWFTAEENASVLAKFNGAKASGQVMLFEFTCSSVSKSVPYLSEKGVTYQSVILNADRFAKRAVSLMAAPTIEGL
jgi:hypothetical protein